MKMSWTLGICLLAVFTVAAAFAQTAPAPSVQDNMPGSLIKIDGRVFVGLFDSGSEGAYPNRAVDIPDAKLRFTYLPSKDVTMVTRLDLNKLNKASANALDYFYLDLNNWAGIAPNQTIRLGKMKEDIGDETWTDNPAESILITNSAAHVSGYDAGVNFRGIAATSIPVFYSVDMFNNTGNPGSASRALGTGAKVGVTPMDDLYVSASLYNSGELLPAAAGGKPAVPALSVGNLTAIPAGAAGWTRRLWEVDARYQYGKNGLKPEVPSSNELPAFQAAASYGRLNDAFAGATNRDASFWFLEGLYNVTQKIYVASRYSRIQLNGAPTVMVDSPVAITQYTRVGIGAGYRISPLTDLKAEYTINTTAGGATSPHLNQLAIGIASKF